MYPKKDVDGTHIFWISPDHPAKRVKRKAKSKKPEIPKQKACLRGQESGPQGNIAAPQPADENENKKDHQQLAEALAVKEDVAVPEPVNFDENHDDCRQPPDTLMEKPETIETSPASPPEYEVIVHTVAFNSTFDEWMYCDEFGSLAADSHLVNIERQLEQQKTQQLDNVKNIHADLESVELSKGDRRWFHAFSLYQQFLLEFG